MTRQDQFVAEIDREITQVDREIERQRDAKTGDDDEALRELMTRRDALTDMKTRALAGDLPLAEDEVDPISGRNLNNQTQAEAVANGLRRFR